MSSNLTEFSKIINEFTRDLIVTFPDKILNTLDNDLKIIITDNKSKINDEKNNIETTNLKDTDTDIDISDDISSNPIYDNCDTNESEQQDTVYKENYASSSSEEKDLEKLAISNLYKYCSTILPERFFDFLYKNDEIFNDETINTKFLPNIEFKELWIEDISDKTRDNIWKYLQLLLFSIITNIDNKNSFGDTLKLFEAIDEDEFKNKLEETVSGLESIFDLSNNNFEKNTNNSDTADLSDNIFNGIPNPKEIHDHIHNIMNGKLGQLAKELAEETAKDFDLTDETINDPKDVFKTLFKNPQKLMNLVKNVGSKLDEKMKSGDIKESELLEEASNMFNNMKGMPGFGSNNMQDMFNNMNIPDLMKNMGMMPPGAKFNQNAFNSKMEQNKKTSKMKERMRTKLDENKKTANNNLEKNNSEKNNSEKNNVQSNIQENLKYIFNNKKSSTELNVLNDNLQNLVEQMKIQNETDKLNTNHNNVQANDPNNQPLVPQNTPRKKKRGKKG